MNCRNWILVIALMTVSFSGRTAVPENHVLPPERRAIEGGREVQILVGQEEIKPNINQSNIILTNHGLGNLFDVAAVGAKSRRTRTAEKIVVPLQAALAGYDFDSFIEQQTTISLTSIDWLIPTKLGFTKKISVDSRSVSLNAAASREVVFIEYEYGMSFNFDAIELNCRVSIADKEVGRDLKPIKQMRIEKMVYTQWHRVFVPLKNPSDEPEKNISRWSEDKAKLAIHALETALGHMQLMIKRGLTQSAQDQQTIEHGANIRKGVYTGNLIEKFDGNTLLWFKPTDQWVLVTAPIE